MTAARRPRPETMPTGHRRRRLGVVATAVGIAMLAAACTGDANGAAPSFTYAPPASPSSSMPGMDMSPSASEPATSASPQAGGPVSAPPPSAPPASAPPSGPGSSASSGAVLHIAAQNIKFDTDHLQAPAGQPFELDFDNNDPGVPHNVEIEDASGASVFKGQIITGPAKASYQIPALAAGTYMFLCDVHPFMTGTLTVA